MTELTEPTSEQGEVLESESDPQLTATEKTEESEAENQEEEPSSQQGQLPMQEVTQSSEESVQEEETTEDESAEEETEVSRIDELIAMVYALKDEYTARLAAIEQAGIDEYNALEEKTAEKKQYPYQKEKKTTVVDSWLKNQTRPVRPILVVQMN